MINGVDAGRETPLRSRVTVPQHVVYRAFPGETVVLNLQTGMYHGLNPTAGRMLAALDRPQTIQEAARVLAEQYSRPRSEVEADMQGLCAELLERGLLELAEDDA